MAFLHGVEVITVDAGARPIEGVSASVIGLLGTALKGPVKIPTLITSRAQAEESFGGAGTIYDAVDAILDQASASIVVVNALDPSVDKSSQGEADHTLVDDKIDLGRKYLVASTVVVKSSDGATTYAAAADYTVDAEAGVVARVAAGAIAAGATLKTTTPTRVR